MEEIKAYKTSNGSLFELKEQAVAYETRNKVFCDLLTLLESEYGVDAIDGVDFVDKVFDVFKKHGWAANISAQDKDKVDYELFWNKNHVVCKCGQPVSWIEHSVFNENKIYVSHCGSCNSQGHSFYTWEQISNLPKILLEWKYNE
jgi:hypothetical protein